MDKKPTSKVPPIQPTTPEIEPPVEKPKIISKKVIMLITCVVILLSAAIGVFMLHGRNSYSPSQPTKKVTLKTSITTTPQTNYDEWVEIHSDFNPNWKNQINNEKTTNVSYCQKATTIPSEILSLKNLTYLDLGENNLTVLPKEIFGMTKLKELILVGNKFSESEQEKIKQQLPNVKIAFTPQQVFNPNFSPTWKTFSSPSANFTFKYHPELQVKEDQGRILLENDFINFTYAWSSCGTDSDSIKFSISTADNPTDQTPVEYLNSKYGYGLVQQGNDYIASNKGKAQSAMLSSVKPYKNGDIDGIIIEEGENDTRTIMAAHNHKFYYLSLFSIGETGSRVSEIAKIIRDQTLATFKYTN